MSALDDPKVRRSYEELNDEMSSLLAYDAGEGVATDLNVAVNWIQKAAAQGNASAQFNLGAGSPSKITRHKINASVVPFDEADVVAFIEAARVKVSSCAIAAPAVPINKPGRARPIAGRSKPCL